VGGGVGVWEGGEGGGGGGGCGGGVGESWLRSAGCAREGGGRRWLMRLALARGRRAPHNPNKTCSLPHTPPQVRTHPGGGGARGRWGGSTPRAPPRNHDSIHPRNPSAAIVRRACDPNLESLSSCRPPEAGHVTHPSTPSTGRPPVSRATESVQPPGMGCSQVGRMARAAGAAGARGSRGHGEEGGGGGGGGHHYNPPQNTNPHTHPKPPRLQTPGVGRPPPPQPTPQQPPGLTPASAATNAPIQQTTPQHPPPSPPHTPPHTHPHSRCPPTQFPAPPQPAKRRLLF